MPDDMFFGRVHAASPLGRAKLQADLAYYTAQAALADERRKAMEIGSEERFRAALVQHAMESHAAEAQALLDDDEPLALESRLMAERFQADLRRRVVKEAVG